MSEFCLFTSDVIIISWCASFLYVSVLYLNMPKSVV